MSSIFGNYTHDIGFQNAILEREVNFDIEHWLEIAKNKNLSRRKRRAAYAKALDLCERWYGTGFDSCDDGAKDCLSDETDPGNSSVSPVSEVSSDSEGTKIDLRERIVLETDEDWQQYVIFLEEREREKIKVKTDRKKAAKLASQRKAAGAEDAAAAAAAKRRQDQEQKSRILNEAVKNPLVPADLGFSWNPVTLCWTSNGSNHELFKGDPFPSEAKILEEIGTACHEVESFLKQIEAEASSAGFLKSLSDSDADDEGDD